MRKSTILSNSLIWAAAILGAALAGAPEFFTIILLPVLASAALLTMRRGQPLEACAKRNRNA